MPATDHRKRLCRSGMIPPSLIYWEVTGDDRMVRELRAGRPLPPR